MKKLVLILFVFITGILSAQDVFQKQLFSADLILKYRDEIGLSEEKVLEVKNLYNDHITTFNGIRWDLDMQMSKMNRILSAERVDEKESQSLMDMILQKEEELKKMRFELMVKLKNMLSDSQQKQLQELKADHGDTSFNFITSMNENPRVSLKISGEDQAPEPLIIIKDRTGKQIAGALDDINSQQIESITVIKGENAIEKHGKKGENGVIIVVLK